jgi:SWI/SNF-related matrix-associated actin-dependent regulator 1 of chromatin subfamily A|nr:MAG TPA: Chromatin remodeling complex ATPase [Caudoviricetes sp.]
MKSPLLPHQKEGVNFILNNSSAFVCDDMGMGKTRTVIEAMIIRNQFPILVICPSSLKLNWSKEIERWTGRRIPIDNLTQDIIITNYERMNKYKFIIQRLPIKQLVLDESHAFKNETSKRTQLALEWSKKIPYKILISGTPMLNRPRELVTQMEILNNIHKVGGREKFLDTYCNPRYSQYGVDYSGCSNIQELHDTMNSIWLRRTKGDLENKLPNKTIVPIPIIEYNQPAPRSFHDIERLDKAVLYKKINYSIDFIKQLLEREEKVVVFVHHKSIGKALHMHFPNASVVVGGQSVIQRQVNIDNFQLHDTQIIICSLQASAVGLTLTASRCAVFIEYPWSPALLAQAQDRIHRLGQNEDVFIFYLYGKGSIDEYRLNTSSFKKAVIDYIIDEGIL